MPDEIIYGGKVHRMALLLVHSVDRQGRPEMVSIIYDDAMVHLEGGEQFYTAFIYDRDV